MLGHHLGVDIKTIIDYYLYQNVSSLTQNAVRAIPLGQTAGQRIVHKMIPIMKETRDHIMTIPASQLGITAPGLEINQMEHENVNVRILYLRRTSFMTDTIKIGVGGPVGAGKTQLIEKLSNA